MCLIVMIQLNLRYHWQKPNILNERLLCFNPRPFLIKKKYFATVAILNSACTFRYDNEIGLPMNTPPELI
jgi:hypothetical protein